MTVVTGPTGAGETTIRVDDKPLCTTHDETALIGNGCRCCTIRSDLVSALRGLAPRPGRVEIAVGEYADPLPILRTFMTDRALGAEFHVDEPLEFAKTSLDDDLLHFVLSEDRPFAWEPFSRAMQTLVATRGADVLLVDGLLNIEGCHGPVAGRYMQHLALPPVELSAWPDGDRRSRLTFITRDVPETGVRRILDAVRALA